MESTGLDRTTLLEHRIVYKQYENSPQNHGRRRLQPQASSSTQKSYKSRSSRDREKCDKDTKAASCEKKQTVDNTPESDLVTLSEVNNIKRHRWESYLYHSYLECRKEPRCVEWLQGGTG
eukprot:1065576-Amorphochlora_amoeboformis.AAC.1